MTKIQGASQRIKSKALSSRLKASEMSGKSREPQRRSLERWSARWGSTFTALGACFTGLGVLVALFGLTYVSVQITDVHRQIQSNASQVVDSQVLDLDKQMMQAEALPLRACFNSESGAKPCPVTANELRAGEPQATLARAIAVQHLDLFDSVYLQRDYLGLRDQPIDRIEPNRLPYGDNWNGWSNFITNTMRASEVMCEALQEHRNEFGYWFVCDLGTTGGCATAIKDLDCPPLPGTAVPSAS